jgi:Flp pilus assembly protein TadD
MRAITKKETQQIVSAGAALFGIAVVCFLLTGCDIPGYKPHRVAQGTDSTSGRSADTQASFASAGVRTGGTTAPTATTPTAPVTTSSSFTDGEAAFRSGRFGDAVGVFAAYVEKKPENAMGHYMLGLSAWKSGDLVKAESELARSTELDSMKVKGWLNLTRVLIEEKKPDLALANVERAIQLDSTTSESFRMLGRAKAELGDVDGAVDAYQRSIKIDDRDVWSLNNLGSLLIEKGRFEEALGPLGRVIVVKPDVATYHNNLGMALEHVGYYVAAAEEYRVAIGIDSTHTKASSNLARVDGKKDKEGLPVLDLPAVVTKFLTDVTGKPSSDF